MSERSFPDGNERFLDRWSRRKRDAEEAETAPASAPDADAVREADLPSIDELGADSDYSAFMRKGVPSDVRNRALRALWRSDPTRFAPDGLEEYGGDQTPSPVAGVALKTVFRIARGSDAAAPEDAPPDDAAADAPRTPADANNKPGDTEV